MVYFLYNLRTTFHLPNLISNSKLAFIVQCCTVTTNFYLNIAAGSAITAGKEIKDAAVEAIDKVGKPCQVKFCTRSEIKRSLVSLRNRYPSINYIRSFR